MSVSRSVGSNRLDRFRDIDNTLAVILAARVPAERIRSRALSRVG